MSLPYDSSGVEICSPAVEYLLSLTYTAQLHLLQFWELSFSPNETTESEAYFEYFGHLKSVLESLESMRLVLLPQVFHSTTLSP